MDAELSKIAMLQNQYLRGLGGAGVMNTNLTDMNFTTPAYYIDPQTN